MAATSSKNSKQLFLYLDAKQTGCVWDGKIVWQGPALLARDARGQVVAVGYAAAQLADVAQDANQVISPLRAELIANEQDLHDWLATIFAEANLPNSFLGRKAVVVVPALMPSSHRLVLKQVLQNLGCRQIDLLDRPRALIKSIFKSTDQQNAGIVFFGLEQSEAAVLLRGEIESMGRINVCWQDVVQAASRAIRREHQVEVSGDQVADWLLQPRVGQTWLRGKSLLQQIPVTVQVGYGSVENDVLVVLHQLAAELQLFVSALPAASHAQFIESGWQIAGVGGTATIVQKFLAKKMGIIINQVPAINQIWLAAASWKD